MQPDTELTSDLIELDGVSFARGDHVIYDNVSLNIPKGKITWSPRAKDTPSSSIKSEVSSVSGCINLVHTRIE